MSTIKEEMPALHAKARRETWREVRAVEYVTESVIYIHHAGTVNAGKDFIFSFKWMRLHQACTISVWKSVLN